MATIHREFDVAVPLQFAWEAVRDVGEVHSRLAAGFVLSTTLEDDVRTVTFFNGLVAKERIVAIRDDLHRLAYAVIEGRPSHHSASVSITELSEKSCRFIWITDLLPDAMEAPIAQMVEACAVAVKTTLESRWREATGGPTTPPAATLHHG